MKLFPIKRPISRFLFISLLLSIVLSSCIENELDFDGIKTQNWNSKWALPLIDSRLTLDDFLTDTSGIINENENGLIYLVYESDELISVSAEDITDLPDQYKEEEQTFDLPVLPPNISGSVPVEFSFNYELEEEGLRIDSMMVKSGYYHFQVKTNLDKDITGVDFEVPNFIHSVTGQSMNFTLDLSNQGGGIIEQDTLIDLSEYILSFNHAFSDTNEIFIHALIHFITNELPVNNPYFFKIENTFTDLSFHKFFGYAGQQSISLSDTINLGIFDYNQVGNFTFGPGSIILNVHALNSFGLPVEIDLSTFRAYRGDYSDSANVYLFGEGNPSIIELNSPTINQLGESIATNISSGSSNLHEVLEISPSIIYADIVGYLNPNGNPEDENFLIDTSAISVSIDLELQLFGHVNDFTLNDTLDFNIGSLEDVESLVFVVDIENGFPINTEVQLTFVDSIGQEVLQLLPESHLLMVAAATNSAPEYKVISPSRKTTEIILTREEMDAVELARKVIINAVLFTTGDQPVKIYSDYDIGLRLGAKVGIVY